MLGVSPTLIRALKPQGDEWPRAHDLSSLRILGSTGEPWDPERLPVARRGGRRGRVPIINISGGTEVGGCVPLAVPRRADQAVLARRARRSGMDVDVFDADGRPVRGEVGELVCKQPWPAMTRGVWQRPASATSRPTGRRSRASGATATGR